MIDFIRTNPAHEPAESRCIVQIGVMQEEPLIVDGRVGAQDFET